MENNKYEEYLSFFESEISDLKKELEKTAGYQKTVDEKIKTLEGDQFVRGGQHYLIEQLKNAVAIENQKISIIDNIVKIKKMALDYTIKDKTNEGADTKNLLDSVNRLIKESKETESAQVVSQNNDDLDAEIEKLLEESDDNE